MAESYSRWRLPQLWEMVAADDAADAHLHLSTLRRQQTALETQRDRLRVLRDQLAQSWPPEKSDASLAFIQRVNDMIRAMELTAVGAAEVRSKVGLIVDALGQARTELSSLVEQYEKAAHLPDHRVREQTRRRLDEHARRVLVTTDAAVVDPAAALNVQLPSYERFSMQASVVTPLGGGGGGAVNGETGRAGVSGPSAPRFDPPEPAADFSSAEFGLAAGGLNSVPSAASPAADVSGPVGGAVGPSVLGPGRVLGGAAFPRGAPTSGSGAANGSAGMHGVIGGGGPSARPAIAASGVGGPAVRGMGGGGAYRDRSFEQYASRRRGPREGQEEVWSLERGVSPLIDVPPIRPHDPGPGVIGIDR